MTHESTMIERLVAAIEQTPVMCGTYAMEGDDATALARAVLEALREPTEAMVGAASVAWNESEAANDDELKAAACRVWQAGINAALSGEGGG